MTRSCLSALFLLLWLAPLSWAQVRQELSLCGDWEAARVKDLASGPPAQGWQPFKVPGALDGYDYERAWFRRDFVIPEAMRGLRLELHFGGVKFNSTVRVNGLKVGGHFGGYEPFDVDITAAARVGETNRLELGCHDWTGVFSDRTTDFSVLRQRAVEVREVPRDKILSPVGGLVSRYGPWDHVELRAHPAIFVRDLFVQPSTRQGRLRVEVTVENQSGAEAAVSLAAAVEDQGKDALALPPTPVTVAAGKQATAVLQAPWPNPRCWSPEDPYLYFLRTDLRANGRAADQVRTRFGFREFWVQGSHFYLNGSRINLLASSWWPSYGQTKEEVADQIRRLKAAGCVCFRTHTQPWPEVWYETADELGLMMIPEGAIWNDNDSYRVNDPVFWQNYAAMLQAEVLRDRNKPSVVMYSLENEFHGPRVNEGTPGPLAELVRLGRLMHQWDPTRPIYYESDGDPGGGADVIGLHYPHEYPDYTDWPNTAYWMDKPHGSSFLPPDWVWDRKKPVYVGEFLWVPASDPSWDSLFFGDDAYLDYAGTHVKAKGEAWRMAIQAYRFHEVGGICPWTMIEGGPLDEAHNACYAQQKYAMQHIAAYVREWDHNFHSGVAVTRTVDLYNDILQPSNLVFHWALVAEGKAPGDHDLLGAEHNVAMGPGERKELKLSFDMPLARARRELKLRLTIRRKGEVVFEDAKDYSLFPPATLKPPPGVALYDPPGRTAAALLKCETALPAVTDLAAIPPDVRILVIGAGALQGQAEPPPVIGAAPAPQKGLAEFLRAGGRALVLEQTQYPEGLLPATLSPHVSTMTFAQMPDHPLLRGLRPEDLKWWRPDNRLTEAEPLRPTTGAFQAVVVSGGPQGINCAPLLERPVGQGVVILCQLKVSERLGVEPAAGLLLQNALDTLAAYQPPATRTALFCPTQATRDCLDAVGLAYRDLTAHPAPADLDACDLLVAAGPLAALAPCADSVRALLDRGGTVLLHRVTPQDLAALPGCFEGMTLTPYKGPAARIPGAHPLSAFFANEDLYWLGDQKSAYSWATRPLATDMTDFVFARTLQGKKPTEYPHQLMKVTGTYADNLADFASLPTDNATATVEIDVPADGVYILGIVAGGTQASGIWPAGAVDVDGKPFGTFACQKGEMDTYTVFGPLTAGKHQVAIRFTNDAYNPPNEDRNLVVKSLLVAADDTPQGGAALLTSPPALVVIPFPPLQRAVSEGEGGKGGEAQPHGKGRLVVDNINWDTTRSNSRKAYRYLCGLLTGLGAQFIEKPATSLRVAGWLHDPAMHWYNNTEGVAYLGDSGYIAGKVQVATAGRYTLRFVCKGTSVKGVGPIVALEIDGAPSGQFEVKSEDWRSYPLTVDLPAGAHQLKLIYTNDEYAPPEDRNLWIERMDVTPA